jgi:hypothetical protein
MRDWLSVLVVAVAVPLLVSKGASAPGVVKAMEADVLVTSAPVYHPLAALKGEERFPEGAQLLRVHQGKAEQLLKDFAAAADASVSFDGKSVLFAGKRVAGDPWQIWELALADGSVRKIIASATDAIRPLYLPAGQLVYASRTSTGFQMVVAGKASPSMTAPIPSDAEKTLLPLSYLRGSAIPADVLQDGRIVFESNSPLGSGSSAEIFVVYSDGSGVEAYRCDHGRARWGGKQLASGDVVFTHGDSLARFTSPMANEVPVAAPHSEYAGGMAETAQGDLLVSARIAPNSAYALEQLAKSAAKPGATTFKTVLAVSGANLVEPMVLAPRTRPHHHPTALHPWNYANLLALDSRLSREGDSPTAAASVRLETQDAQGHVVANGTAPVESDGSFFVQAPADRPIRFALLNAKGEVVRQEHGWFWARSGEQRFCTGCHTGPERAPENRIPAVLQRTTVPVDLTGVKAAGQLPTTTPGGK